MSADAGARRRTWRAERRASPAPEPAPRTGRAAAGRRPRRRAASPRRRRRRRPSAAPAVAAARPRDDRPDTRPKRPSPAVPAPARPCASRRGEAARAGPPGSAGWPRPRGARVVVALLAGLCAVLRPFIAKRRAIAEVQRYALPERRVEDPEIGLVDRAAGRLGGPAPRQPVRRAPRGARPPRAAGARRLRRGRRSSPGRASWTTSTATSPSSCSSGCPASPRSGRARGPTCSSGRGRGRLVRTTWDDGLVPMQGATVAWADGYDLFSLEAWATASAGEAFACGARGALPRDRPEGHGRGPDRRGGRAAGRGGAGTFPGRAASSGCRAPERGPRPGGRARPPPSGW